MINKNLSMERKDVRNENKVITRVTYHRIMNNYTLFMCIMILSFQITTDLPLYSYTVQTWKERKKTHPETPSSNHWPTDQHQSTRDPQNSNNCYTF